MTHIATFDQIAIVLLCAAEAWLEHVVIQLKNPLASNYATLNKREHKRSAIYYFALVGCITVLTWEQIDHHIWLVIAAMLWRRIVFTYGLKLLRQRKFKVIEGDQYTDRIVRSVFGMSPLRT
jgi:hypothetical protein